MNTMLRRVTLMITSIILLVLGTIVFSYAQDYYTLEECQGYLREIIYIEGEPTISYEPIPESEGQPEYIILGNYYQIVWYLPKGQL